MDGRLLSLSAEAGLRHRSFRPVRYAAPNQPRSASAQACGCRPTSSRPRSFYSLLDEQQRRLYAGLEAAKIGHGGDSQIAQLLSLDPDTVARGRGELPSGDIDRNLVRRTGRGPAPKSTPDLIATIEKIMADDTAADPVTGANWCRRTTEKIADELRADGIDVSVPVRAGCGGRRAASLSAGS